MKTKTKILVAALTAAGVVAPLQQAFADTITGPVVVPALPQSVAPGVYSVTYPVVVTPTGGTPQALNFVYNSDDTWTAPSGWTFLGQLNNDANTAVFGTTLGDGSNLSIALSSTGAAQFVPGQTGAVVTPPSVGLLVANRPVSGTVLSGFAAATATGAIDGRGATTATLVAAPTSVQVIGLNPGGTPPASATVGAGSVSPTSATATPGYAVGSVNVNSNQAAQSIGWGQYTVTVPQTPTPAGTTTVAASVAGSSGSVGANGIAINNISGDGTYNVGTGAINVTPVETAVFSVDTSGNTAVGGNLSVAGSTATNGIVNTGLLATQSLAVSGNGFVGGTLATNGIANTGPLGTQTLVVSGNSFMGGTLTSNGIVNSGLLGTQTLAVSGNGFVGGTLTTNGISNTGTFLTNNLNVTGLTATNGIVNTGNLVNTATITTTGLQVTGNATVGGTLGVTGAATLNGNATIAGNTTVGGTLGVTGAATLNGATTIGSASGTGGNTATINSSGIVLSTAGVGANNVTVNSSGSSMTGGGATLRMANGVATFSGANTAPIRVTGVADGQDQYDAVNRGQLNEARKSAERAAAGAAALAGIPQVEQGKNFNIGVGVGGVESEAAFAVGGSARVGKDFILKGGVGFTNDTTTWNLGGGWSW